jgi:hypothetical protein
MKRLIIVILGAIFITGCAKLSHLEQLLTLKGLSDEQARFNKLVEEQDKKFELLVETIHTDDMSRYPNEKSILKKFGDPIYTKNTVRDGRELTFWLYRYATQYFGSEKVYLYFDPTGNLVEWEHLTKPGLTEQSERKSEVE